MPSGAYLFSALPFTSPAGYLSSFSRSLRHTASARSIPKHVGHPDHVLQHVGQFVLDRTAPCRVLADRGPIPPG